MKQVNGWHLPAKDGYFTRFVEGNDYKKNGFQREHLELAIAHVETREIAIDVGAHVGFWTLDMAAAFDHVFAFEPAPDTFECLLKNTLGIGNVTCCNAAIGAIAGKCDLNDDTDRPGNTGSRFITVGPKAKHGDVEMLRLDDLNFIGCDLLKIDVEGFEMAVLEGARALIKAFRPVIIMETDKRFKDRYGFTKDASRVFVLEMGYVEDEHLEPDPRPGAQGRYRNAIRPDRIFLPE